MSKKCIATFSVNSADGTSTTFELEVLDVEGLTPEEAIQQLINNKELLDTVSEAINRSGFPLVKIDTDAIQKNIPVGNYTLAQIANEYATPNIAHLVDKLKEIGIDINQQNILLTTASFSQRWNKSLGIYEKNGKSIVLLKPDAKSIEPYLKQLYAYEVYKREDKAFKESLEGYIVSTLEDLERASSETSRITSSIKAIRESNDPTKEFIRYFYTSSGFSHALYTAGRVNQFKQLFNEFLNSASLAAQYYDDSMVKSFVLLTEGNKITMSNMQKLMDEYSLTDPIKTIQEINNKIKGGQKFFDIKFIGSDAILFHKSKLKPLFEVDAINSEYFGEMVDPVISFNGFNIVKYNDKFYISDRIITNVEGLRGRGYDSVNGARGAVNSILEKNKLSLTSIRNKVKQGVAVTSLQKMNVGDRISSLDIELQTLNLNSTDKKLATLTYSTFIQEMDKSALWKKVSEALTLEGLKLHEILDTPEKVETFIMLRAQNRDSDIYSAIYTNKAPRIDTPEKIKFETDLSRDALITIRDAKEKVYEVIAHNADKYLMEEVKGTTDVPLHSKQPKSFKSELINVADHLSKNYGIKVNIVTTGDIMRDFKEQIPNAGRINAFIYNGEVFINVDRAMTSDPLHEFAHLVLGSIKSKNSDAYYGLVSQVETLPDYSDRLDTYIQNGDKRARMDLNEEIFVTMFGEYFSNRINPWFNNKAANFNELGNQFRESTQKAFQIGEDINSEKLGVLLNMSMDELMNEFGSALISYDRAADFDLDGAYKSRTIANLISKMLNSGELIENCE